jgi:hypothetical protein
MRKKEIKESKKKKKETEIDVIASLTPISWRRSTLGAVTVGEQPGGSSGSRAQQSAPSTNSTAKKENVQSGMEENGEDTIPCFNIKWVDHAKET